MIPSLKFILKINILIDNPFKYVKTKIFIRHLFDFSTGSIARGNAKSLIPVGASQAWPKWAKWCRDCSIEQHVMKLCGIRGPP